MNKSRTKRILVVDDQEMNRLVANAILAGLGYEVVEAGDGAEAVAAMDEGSYDLVLMDCHMPVMDGLAAAGEIRRRRHTYTPIVGYTTNDNRSECLQAGMNDHLVKPAEPEVLRATVERWLALAA